MYRVNKNIVPQRSVKAKALNIDSLLINNPSIIITLLGITLLSLLLLIG